MLLSEHSSDLCIYLYHFPLFLREMALILLLISTVCHRRDCLLRYMYLLVQTSVTHMLVISLLHTNIHAYIHTYGIHTYNIQYA
ncbi:hypothetical protein V8C37DRAFT_387477 [Trichoderma ceciliae]